MVCAGRALKIVAFQPSAMGCLPLNQVAPSSVLGHFYLFSLFINLFSCHCYSFNSLNNTARWAEWQNPSGIAEWQNPSGTRSLGFSWGDTGCISLCPHLRLSSVLLVVKWRMKWDISWVKQSIADAFLFLEWFSEINLEQQSVRVFL